MTRFYCLAIGLLMVFNIREGDARVYCQDTNAAPRTSLGFTCPVVCASIQNAINRLIMQDYKITVKEQLGNRPKAINRIINENDYADDYINGHYVKLGRKSAYNENENVLKTRGKIVNREDNIQTDNNDIKESMNIINKVAKYTVNTRRTEEKHEKDNLVQENDSIKSKIAHNIPNLDILEDIKDVKGIFRRSSIAINKTEDLSDNNMEHNDGKCWYLEKFKEKLLIGKIVRKKCTRRSNFDGKFITVMTNVLNKYVNTIFRFTDEMTEILLENIFGRNVDLRNNIFDVNKLLHYLRKSVDRHRIHSHNQVITLKSKHCLTVSMPGCFCRSGYVESSGQCVKPEDCITNEKYMPYLTRIIVL